MKKYLFIILFLLIFPTLVYALPVGDVDGDGQVKASDYILVRKHLLRKSELTGDSLARADVDGKGGVTAADYIIIRKIMLGTLIITPSSIPKATKIHFIKQTISNYDIDHEAGDAILLESTGHFAMIDTGYESKIDNEFIYNYLNKVGVKKLDFILLTHPDSDHRGGAIYLMNNLEVDCLYIKTTTLNWYDTIINTAKSKNIPVKYIEKEFIDGKSITLNNMDIKLYNVRKETKDDLEDVNRTSVMQLVSVDNYKVFLAADLAATESCRNYLNDISKTIGKIDVLKLPHHGYWACGMSNISASNFNPNYIIVTNKFTEGRTGCYGMYFSNTPVYYNNDSSLDAVVVDLTSNLNIIK